MSKSNVLITPTLLDSFNFVKNAPPSWQTKAMNDFVAKIRREKGTFPLWVKKGIDFENAVYRICAGKTEDSEITVGSDFFKKVCYSCIGGTFQNVFKKTIFIDDQEVLLYNKTDVAFPDKIKDIKTTLNWKGKEKYLRNSQHKMYLYASERPSFEYLVVQWKDAESNDILDYHVIPYKAPELQVLEDEIVELIKELFTFLRKENLYDDYYHIFSNNRR